MEEVLRERKAHYYLALKRFFLQQNTRESIRYEVSGKVFKGDSSLNAPSSALSPF